MTISGADARCFHPKCEMSSAIVNGGGKRIELRTNMGRILIG